MKIINEIDISLIRMDRYPINEKTLRLVDYLRNGGVVPEIKVAKHPLGGFIIKDGRHRITAYRLLGRKTIKAKYSNKPQIIINTKTKN